jgi:hypothetical protein
LPPGTTVTAALEWLAGKKRQPKPLPEPGSVELEKAPLLRFCPPDMPTPTIVTMILRVFFPTAETALDSTYGNGGFWDGSAHVTVTARDIDPSRAPHGVTDFRAMSYDDNTFDVALFDGPHLADSSDGSIMGDKFGTYPDAELKAAIQDGAREAWRIGRLGCVIKVTDHVHGERLQEQTDWVKEAVGMDLFEKVHQTRSSAVVDPKWGDEQLSTTTTGRPI